MEKMSAWFLQSDCSSLLLFARLVTVDDLRIY